jgi:hypothetical protein
VSIRHTRKQWDDLQEQERKAQSRTNRTSRAEKKRLGEVGRKSDSYVPRLEKAPRRKSRAE